MLSLNSKIIIGNLRLPTVISVKIVESQELLIDYAEIEVFRSAKDSKGKEIQDFFSVGDKVEINLGYNGILKNYFKGYYTKATTSEQSVKFLCYDEGWKFEGLTTEKYYFLEKTTFKKLFEEIAPKIPLNIVDADIGDWEIDKGVKVFDVIEELKQKFGIFPYFRDGVLTFNKFDLTQTFIADFQKNCVKSRNDVGILIDYGLAVGSHVEGRSRVQENGKTTQIISYYSQQGSSSARPNGTCLGQVEIPNLTLDKLNEILKIRYESFNTSGIVGEIETLGMPRVRHGMVCKIIDKYRADLNEKQVYINTVQVDFNNNDGFCQKIKLGKLK